MLMACPPSGLVSKRTHVMFEDSGGVSALVKCSCLRDIVLPLSSIKDNIIMAKNFRQILIQVGCIFIQANGYWVFGYGIEQGLVRLKMRFDSEYMQLQAYLTTTSFAQCSDLFRYLNLHCQFRSTLTCVMV